MSEQWKPVLGFEDLYTVSNRGRVWSVRAEKTLRPGGSVYPMVVLCRGGNTTARSIHSLVLEAFVGPRPKGAQCRHLDGSRDNNRLENLAWGTVSENQADRVRHGTSNRGERCGASVLTADDVCWIRAWARSGYLQREIAEAFGVTRRAISSVVTGCNWAHVEGVV